MILTMISKKINNYRQSHREILFNAFIMSYLHDYCDAHGSLGNELEKIPAWVLERSLRFLAAPHAWTTAPSCSAII